MRCSRTSTASPGRTLRVRDRRAGAAALCAAAIFGIAHAAPAGEDAASALLGDATEFLRARASEAGLTLQAVSVEAPEAIDLPPGSTSHRFRIARPVQTGRLTLTAVVEENGRPVRALLLTADVIVEAEVFVAADDLPPGKVIGRSDYRTETRALPEGLDPRDTRVKPAGREVRAPISRGVILTEAALKRPRDVIRGEIVTLLAEGRGYRVRVSARAARDGALGEMIPVVNTSSGQTILAEVVGRGVLRLGPAAGTEEVR